MLDVAKDRSSRPGTDTPPRSPDRDDLPGERIFGPAVTGHVRVHREIPSKHLRLSRDVFVYLPPTYTQRNDNRRYHVLYMHDGNNLFDSQAAFGGQAWEVDETAEKCIRSGDIVPLIVVGVANTADRMDEYTWAKHKLGGKLMGGRGADYARFMVEELKPFIDRTYRTNPDRKVTGVAGSSLGGLMSLYLAINHADVFSRVAILSPSLYWSNSQALKDAAKIPKNLRIWLDMGWHEEEDRHRLPAMVADLRKLSDVLEKRGYHDGINLNYVEDPVGRHDEATWERRMLSILRFLYAPDVD